MPPNRVSLILPHDHSMNSAVIDDMICKDRIMAQPMIPRDLLPSDPRFGCGPSRIRREVVASLSEPGSVMGTSHRQPPVRHVVAAIREELTELYNLPTDYEVALGNGGATLFWDMATVSLVEKRAATGVYGEFTRKFSSALQRAPFLADPAVFQAEPGKLALPKAVSDVDTYAWPITRPPPASLPQSDDLTTLTTTPSFSLTPPRPPAASRRICQPLTPTTFHRRKICLQMVDCGLRSCHLQRSNARTE